MRWYGLDDIDLHRWRRHFSANALDEPGTSLSGVRLAAIFVRKRSFDAHDEARA
jgi:hypothetical protein